MLTSVSVLLPEVWDGTLSRGKWQGRRRQSSRNPGNDLNSS